ncbi:ATP-binding protein [Streptomyces sp. B-S-A8]|uniref:ATP-binding protein n=1 Tax=Streptomyces solicavernae TaxID=3043614 RepID=A0ABT6RL36_9ACTN|nr:ATP-binding protein [Streptomyces sp. B-S-A8]MDI3385146.1 ATP-binding protein [Streptomyces sp. B-S-A8]
MKAQIPSPDLKFRQMLSATPRGARLARRLACCQLEEWGFPHGGETSRAAASIVAELAVNAVTHGRVSGRDFALTLLLRGELLRIEVADACAERRPEAGRAGGFGLRIVAALADSWGVRDRRIGKIVWAEVSGLKRSEEE